MIPHPACLWIESRPLWRLAAPRRMCLPADRVILAETSSCQEDSTACCGMNDWWKQRRRIAAGESAFLAASPQKLPFLMTLQTGRLTARPRVSPP